MKQKLCFVPKAYKFEDVFWNDEKFLTIALREGKVLTADEFENMCRFGQSLFDNHYMKLMEVYDTTWEMCPYCESEVELSMKWEVQRCPECGEYIIPCSICYPDDCDCANCPLEALVKSLNEVREKSRRTSD